MTGRGIASLYLEPLLFPRFALSPSLQFSITSHSIMASPRKFFDYFAVILCGLKLETRANYVIPTEVIRTPITDLLKINHPVLLAGMNVAAGPKLAAAVTNAGGLGVIGGVGYTPDMLREQVAELKSYLKDKNAPFGVDLLLPQVGGSARKTK